MNVNEFTDREKEVFGLGYVFGTVVGTATTIDEAEYTAEHKFGVGPIFTRLFAQWFDTAQEVLKLRNPGISELSYEISKAICAEILKSEFGGLQ